MRVMAEASGQASPSFNLLYVGAVCLVAAMGGLLFGYDWVVIGGAKPFFEKYFNLTGDAQVGWANSCALLGCLAGSLVSGALSDRMGRKRLLQASALLFAVSSVLTGWSGSFAAFIAWRIAGGVAIGMASNLSPLYIAEVAPAHLRGRLVALNQLMIVVGILAAQIVNLSIAEPVPSGATAEAIRLSWNGQVGWRWMFTAVAAPALLFFAGSLLVPESPRWLILRGWNALAHAVLARVGGRDYADAQAADIRAAAASEAAAHLRPSELFAPRMRGVLLVGVSLAVLQQWSGINVLFNYAEEIYRSAGFGVSEVLFNIVITGAINLAFTLVAIGTVDRLGRRLLMLVGCAGIGLSHALLGAAYVLKLKGVVVLLFTLCSLGCYAMSLAPVTWVLIAEIFPNRIRGAAISVAVSALWVACFVLTYTFPLLNGALGTAKTFWLYAAICFAGFFFVRARVPETKGRSLEEIEKEFAT